MVKVTLKLSQEFSKLAKKLMTQEVLEELYSYLEIFPEAGKLIKGTGGARKLRWRTGKNDQGKRGGVRIIYFYAKQWLVLLITVYSKTEKDNLSQAECQQIKRMLGKLDTLLEGK